MKVILVQDVPKLGRRGLVADVAEGYARNYLLPRGLALPAEQGLLQDLAEREKAADAREKRLADRARTAAAKIDGQEVVIRARAGETGKLFGAVTNKEVAESLARDFRVQVDRRKIELPGPIKATGTYNATVRLHPQIAALITVIVTGEG